MKPAENPHLERPQRILEYINKKKIDKLTQSISIFPMKATAKTDEQFSTIIPASSLATINAGMLQTNDNEPTNNIKAENETNTSEERQYKEYANENIHTEDIGASDTQLNSMPSLKTEDIAALNGFF